MSQSIWLNIDLMRYEHYVSAASPTAPGAWRQQYEIYQHAESILKGNPSEHDLACAIFQLNRAVDFREKLLANLYKFKKIPGLHGTKHHEAMSQLEIIKPLLKTNLDKIRNNVMHSAAYPVPKASDVAELSEFTWYFLKATDLIASRVPSMLFCSFPSINQQEEYAELWYGPDSWEIEIRGECLSRKLGYEPSEELLEVYAHKIEQRGSNTYFAGKLLGPKNVTHTLMKAYFAAL